MSSIAFVVVGGFGGARQEQLKPLESFVIEGDIDPRLESAYLSRGFTFLKYYYKEKDEALENYLDALPELTRTNQNQQQLIIQKIPSGSDRIIVRGPGGETSITNATEINIFQTLCSTIAVVPFECALNITS